MYDAFMTGLIDFLIEAGRNQPNQAQGCTEQEIAQLESSLDYRLPVCYVAFLRAMGRNAVGLTDGEVIEIDGLQAAREVAEELTANPKCHFSLSPEVLPISQHDGYNFHFISLTSGDDSPVLFYLEGESEPKVSMIAFSVWLREWAILGIEREPSIEEWCQEIARAKGSKDWLERKVILDGFNKEASEIRLKLIEEVHERDQKRGQITSPTEFQELWQLEFSKTPLWATLKQEGKRMPWGWVSPLEVC